MVSVALESSSELFIHVPKVAGGSISRALLARPDATRYAVTDMKSAEPCVSQLQQHLPEPISSYTSTACVRNPWDWAVSGYLHVSENMPAYNSPPSFRDFVLGDWDLASENPYPSKFSNPVTYVAYHTQISQWEHLGGREGIETIDHICRFESLESDLAKTGLPITELPHIHKSERRSHYSDYFDQELIELVRVQNEELLEFFGYEFESS